MTCREIRLHLTLNHFV